MFGLTEEDIKQIVAVLKRFEELDECIIFGSRVKDTYRQGSDIDIALKGMGISHAIVLSIKHALNEELPLPYFFDVVDYATIESRDLIEHIDRVGKVMYKCLSEEDKKE